MLSGEGAADVQAATGNATTDTANIQAAINSLPHPIGGTVNLQSGTYVINKILIPKNVTLQGNSTTLQAANGLDDNMIRNHYPNVGDSNIIIDGIAFEGNSANQTPLANPNHAIGFYNVANWRISNCTFNDFELDGIYLGTTGSIDSIAVNDANTDGLITGCDFTNIRRNGVSVTRAARVRILHSDFTDCNLGVLDDDGYLAGAIDIEPNDVSDLCEDIEVGYCTFDSQYAPSIQLAGSASKQRINIHHCTIAQNGAGRAVAVFTPVDVVDIDDCAITTIGASGIWVNGQGQDITNITAERNTITGNDAADTVGIGFGDVVGGVIDANHITDYPKAALVNSSDTITVTNNIWTSCTVDVDVTGGSTNVSQSNNTTN